MILVTCALLVKNGKILITQNGYDSDHPYQWEFPGGKIKPGETGTACVKREIMEELELEIKIVETLKPVEHDYGIKQIKLIPFVCKLVSGSIKLNNHISEKWIELAAVEGIDFSEADRKLIENTHNYSLLQKYSRK